jgi:LemA protein
MGIFVYIVGGTIILLLIYILVIYNGFVRANNKVKEAFATMDVYLKKRWDLIPNIVETVKGYAKHEKETLENIVKLRNGAYDNMSINDKIDKNEKLTPSISKLMVLAENYPDLKSNQNFMDLSSQMTKAEDEIASSRKYYNAVVRDMNNKIEMFPSNIFAKLFGFKEMKMFEANESERQNIKVEL